VSKFGNKEPIEVRRCGLHHVQEPHSWLVAKLTLRVMTIAQLKSMSTLKDSQDGV
jgi:hypothetical protein